MTSRFDYVEHIFPAALVHRLLSGVGQSRYVMASRAPDRYFHFPAAQFARPAEIVHLFHYKHLPDASGAPTCRIPRQLWDCTTLHMGWIHLRRAADATREDTYGFEVVFDLDLPAYDGRAFPIRGGFLCDCASTNRGCCRACWLLVRTARATLEALVPREWGPGLWVYSGGKGAHCIYGSEKARLVPKDLREAFVTSLGAMSEGRENAAASLVAVLRSVWEEAGVRDLQVLARDEACHILANAFLTGAEHAKFLLVLANTPGDSVRRWAAFVRIARPDAVKRFLCELALPRFDPNPLKQTRGHIKCPFSLHMTSRRVALPLPDPLFARFDPRDAPSLDMEGDKLREGIQASCLYFEQWLNTNEYS